MSPVPRWSSRTYDPDHGRAAPLDGPAVVVEGPGPLHDHRDRAHPGRAVDGDELRDVVPVCRARRCGPGRTRRARPRLARRSRGTRCRRPRPGAPRGAGRAPTASRRRRTRRIGDPQVDVLRRRGARPVVAVARPGEPDPDQHDLRVGQRRRELRERVEVRPRAGVPVGAVRQVGGPFALQRGPVATTDRRPPPAGPDGGSRPCATTSARRARAPRRSVAAIGR